MHKFTLLIVLLLIIPLASVVYADETEEYYYAIEQQGVISGYAHVIISHTECDKRPCLKLIDSIWMKVEALGKPFEGKYRFEYHLDPTDGNYFYHTSNMDQGGTSLGAVMSLRGDSMYIMSEGDTSAVHIPSGTITESSRLYKHLIDSFVKDTLSEKECQVFSERDGNINHVAYFNRGREKLTLAGKDYDALVIESRNLTTGVQTKTWLDAGTGLLLKTHHPFRDTYLSDRSIKDRTARADLARYLMVPTNKMISDPAAISYMKIRAALQPGGLWLTAAGLSVPGQKFDGTVKDNYVDGVFEVSHRRYDGSNAPPFPCDFSGIDTLREYLEPSNMIESNDSSLIREAKAITKGAKDVWDAATRLSRWVHEEIKPDVPGGGTALRTYQMRLGECGSHSNLLSAFCRAVGIPARGVFGCMYVPDHGGAFCQHGWNEIFMGAAGWIPVDCTADEITYADCGHIRLGTWTSTVAMLNGKSMEILDYRLASDSSVAARSSDSVSRFDPYLGKYQGDKGELSIVVQNASLGLSIPGRGMVFELKDPDSTGYWFFKLTNAASILFAHDSVGHVSSMTIREFQGLPRKLGDDSTITIDTVAEACRPFVGSYVVPMQNLAFRIVCVDNQLALHHPAGKVMALTKSEQDEKWFGKRSENTHFEVAFDREEDGRAAMLRLTTRSLCNKIP